MSRPPLWPTAPAHDGGADRSPTASPAAPLPVRSTPPLSGGSALAARVKLGRLADLLTEAGKILRELSEVQLEEVRETRLMSHVETTRLLTVKDVAERLVLSERTVRRLRRQGALPSGIEVAGTIRWRPEEIDAWVVSR